MILDAIADAGADTCVENASEFIGNSGDVRFGAYDPDLDPEIAWDGTDSSMSGRWVHPAMGKFMILK